MRALSPSSQGREQVDESQHVDRHPCMAGLLVVMAADSVWLVLSRLENLHLVQPWEGWAAAFFDGPSFNPTQKRRDNSTTRGCRISSDGDAAHSTARRDTASARPRS